MRHYRFVFELFILSLLAPVMLFSQSQAIDGNVEGFIRDQNGAALADVHVRATNKQTNQERAVDTDDKGYYQLQLLPPGAYTVSAAKTGFSTKEQSNLALAAGQVVKIDLQLAVGEVSTTIEVTESVPAVETGRTNAYNNVYTGREVRNVPAAGRSFLDFFVVNPIVNAPPLSTGGSGTGTPSVSYGGLGFRQINVDGVSNNIQGGARNLVISQDAIGEVQTVTNYSAEFGRQAAILLNSLSRSGSNDWHGSAFFFTRQRALSARPFLLSATAPQPDFARYNYGATLGGPVVKDKAFFFLSYERWSQNLPQVSTFGGNQQLQIANSLGISPAFVGAFDGNFRAHTVTAKGDWVLSEKNRLMMRYNYYRDRESPLGGGQSTSQTASRFDENPQSGTVQLVTAIDPTKLNEFRFLYIKRDISNGVTDPFTPQINIQGIGNYNGNQDGTFVSNESGYQIVDNFTWNKGRHSIKVGFDLLPATFQERTRNLNGTFTFSGLPAVAGVRGAVTPLNQTINTRAGVIDPVTLRPYTYTQFSRAQGQQFTEATVVNQGYFIQDEVRVNSKLKLNLGLRYELFLRPSAVPNPANALTSTIPQDYNNIAPRLAAAYDPIGDGKTVVRAGYGIYYNTTVAQTFNTVLRGNGLAVQNLTLTPNQIGAPAFTQGPVAQIGGATPLPSDLYVFDRSFRDPMVHSYFATFERQILRDQSVAVSYLGNRARALPYSNPSNLAVRGQLADGRTLYGGTSGRPNPAFGTIFNASSNGYQDFNAMLITFTQRARAGLSFQAGYQYQNVRGSSYLNSSGAFTSFGAFTTPSDPANPGLDRGFGDFSQPHRFTLTAVWEPKLSVRQALARSIVNGWSLTTRTIAQSGLPFSAVTGQDNNGDLQFNDRPTGYSYNGQRLPNYVEVDVRLARSFQLGELGALQVMGEVFNLPNRLNVTNVNRTFGPNVQPNANFNTTTSAETARQFQLGVRYSF